MQQVGVETICAQIMTIPLILWAFGQFSVFALLANILVVPLIPLTMLATFAAGIAALGLPFLAGLAGLPATLLTSYMTSVTNWLASVPWAVIETSLTNWAMVAMYLAVGLFGLLVWRRTNYDFLQSSITD
jgi:competence protein ComEC